MIVQVLAPRTFNFEATQDTLLREEWSYWPFRSNREGITSPTYRSGKLTLFSPDWTEAEISSWAEWAYPGYAVHAIEAREDFFSILSFS